MRTKLRLRPAYVLGALALAIPSSAFALGAGQSLAKGAPQTTTTTTATVQTAAYRQVPPRLVILTRQAINVLAGHVVHVRGRVVPAQSGRHVELQGLDGRRWRRLATATTGAGGGFTLRYVGTSPGTQRLRVRFADPDSTALAHIARVAASAPRVTVFRESVASWYDDGGSTACGFHATMGVANKTLPCGTKVRFRLGRRSVTATVDDRGPFVAGRDWDLNQNAAAALGVSGVAGVWSSA